jgi:bifunctional DNA-binding transcriptional regulator/antitoxin component of YhaV-PrlF toxin-antitoxin module
MSRVDVDSHGRIYIPKDLRDRYGESFRIVPFRGKLKLVPVPDDPVKDLRDRTEDLRDSDKSVKDLKEEARRELEDLAGE